MGPNPQPPRRTRAEVDAENQRTSLAKMVKIGFLVFLGLLVVLAVIAIFFGDDVLPMQYEGFD